MGNYLYNGAELPEFPKPENDALISFLIVRSENESQYQLLCSSKEFVRIHHSGDYYYFISRSDVQCKYSFYYPKDGYWSELYNFTGTSASTGYATKMQYVWSSHDVYNEDGTLFAAASEPIPVAAPALDPLSLFMGWKAGNWVARQRGKAKPATGVYDDTMPIEWKMQDVANNKKIPFETYQIYSYNGLEFGRPDIEADSAYKYHLIEKYSSGYHYWCLKQPFVYINEDKEYAKIEGGYNYSLYICKTGEIGFGHHDDISGDDLKLNWEDIIWTNTNICDADGTVRMAATEPVYIREQVNNWLVKISNYIPSLEIFEKSAVSISYGGEEGILPYVYGDNSYTGCTIVLFMDVTTYTNFVMLAIEKADNEVIPGEPGLYFLTIEPIPGDVTFKVFVPDET